MAFREHALQQGEVAFQHEADRDAAGDEVDEDETHSSKVQGKFLREVHGRSSGS